MSDSLPSGIFVEFGTVFVVIMYFCGIWNCICGNCVFCTLIKQCIYRIKKSLLKIAADDPKLGMSLDD